MGTSSHSIVVAVVVVVALVYDIIEFSWVVAMNYNAHWWVSATQILLRVKCQDLPRLSAASLPHSDSSINMTLNLDNHGFKQLEAD